MAVQQATLGSGACLLGAASVLQGHGMNRPLELRCEAVLKAWELHFGAGALSGPGAELAPFFTRIQKRRQASGQHVFGGRSVLQ